MSQVIVKPSVGEPFLAELFLQKVKDEVNDFLLRKKRFQIVKFFLIF